MKNLSYLWAVSTLMTALVLTGCSEETNTEKLSEINSNRIDVPKDLSELGEGFYEIGTESSLGLQICKASVFDTYSRGNHIVLADCKNTENNESVFIKKIDVPRELYMASPGAYSVDLQTSAGLEACVFSVIDTYSRSKNRVILSGCTPR